MTICAFASRPPRQTRPMGIPDPLRRAMGLAHPPDDHLRIPAHGILHRVLYCRWSARQLVVQYVSDPVGTILSWFLMTRVGLYGTFTLFWLLLIIGFVSLAPQSSTMNWAKVRCSLSLPSHMTLWLVRSATRLCRSSRQRGHVLNPWCWRGTSTILGILLLTWLLIISPPLGIGVLNLRFSGQGSAFAVLFEYSFGCRSPRGGRMLSWMFFLRTRWHQESLRRLK